MLVSVIPRQRRYSIVADLIARGPTLGWPAAPHLTISYLSSLICARNTSCGWRYYTNTFLLSRQITSVEELLYYDRSRSERANLGFGMADCTTFNHNISHPSSFLCVLAASMDHYGLYAYWPLLRAIMIGGDNRKAH